MRRVDSPLGMRSASHSLQRFICKVPNYGHDSHDEQKRRGIFSFPCHFICWLCSLSNASTAASPLALRNSLELPHR
jgi:hypothetical protein